MAQQDMHDDPQQLELLRVAVHVLLCHAVNRSLSVIDGRP